MRASTHVALALGCAAGLGLLAWYASLSPDLGHGRLDFARHALGRDFVNLWTAGRLIGEGRTLEVFDPAAFMAAHHRLFSPALPFHFWSYPPPALLLAAPFALTPGYFAGLAAWTAFGWLALLPAARLAIAGPAGRAGGGETALLMLSPAVAVNVGLGQNGALTAALLLAGLTLMDLRPLAAGALLGLLVFKPQLALLLPVMVLAGRRWRVMAGAAASAAVVLALSTLIFGGGSWVAFLHGSAPMQSQMLREGRGPFLAMMPSAFAAARLLQAPWTQAAAWQLPFTALGVWLAWRTWRGGAEPSPERIALFAAATFLATPQAFNYDLIPIAFAALVLLRARGEAEPSRADALAAVAAWLLPAAMIGFVVTQTPLAPLVLAFLALRLSQRVEAGASFASRSSAAGEAASHT